MIFLWPRDNYTESVWTRARCPRRGSLSRLSLLEIQRKSESGVYIIHILKPSAVKWAKRCYHGSVCVGKQFSENRGASSSFAIGRLGPASFFAAHTGVRLCAMYSPLLITTNFIRHRARWDLFSSRACGIRDDAAAAAASLPLLMNLNFASQHFASRALLLTLFLLRCRNFILVYVRGWQIKIKIWERNTAPQHIAAERAMSARVLMMGESHIIYYYGEGAITCELRGWKIIFATSYYAVFCCKFYRKGDATIAVEVNIQHQPRRQSVNKSVMNATACLR